MDNNLLSKINNYQKQIELYPTGSISKKQINGKIYYYHRTTVDGKRKEKYIPANEVKTLESQISKRKSIEKELKELKMLIAKENVSNHTFLTNVQTGSLLRSFSSAVKDYKKRDIYQKLHDYVYGNTCDKVFILFGLRRTGKTTMIRQILADMPTSEFNKAAFIQANSKTTLADINKDLKYLQSKSYTYIFIDEVTLISDFIEGAALFSDIYAACSMKIVLSGTDSLGFLFAEDDQLYDRFYQVHTTHIPYREFERVLNIKGIDEYIRYGGTMSLEGIHYNESSIFSSKEKTDEYIDSAIAHNIQHSLKHYQYEGHFRNLKELYEHNELTNAINRVIENINQAFVLKVLTSDFKSHDFGRSASNLRRSNIDILDNIDKETLNNRLRKALEIYNINETKVQLKEEHLLDITQYLLLLDMIKKIIERNENSSSDNYRFAIMQSGIRYSQANALVEALLKDENFSTLSIIDKSTILNRIKNEIKGRILEDIILLETQLAKPDKEVFAFHFDIGEFDMVLFDRENICCSIYEIKHSTEINKEQYKHLIDENKCKSTEFRFGKIIGKYVIYRGDNTTVDGIEYLNVEDYLRSL